MALMVTPFMIALMEEIVRATPQGARNAALALGATRWEVVRDVLRGAFHHNNVDDFHFTSVVGAAGFPR